MFNGRSWSSNRNWWPTAVALLLMVTTQVNSMSLDRLALERNELPAGAADTSDLLVDDMKLTSVNQGADGNTDMYMLVPETVEDTVEHVNRNTIELEPDTTGSSNTDMLMLESDDTPAIQLVELPSEMVVEQKPTSQEVQLEQAVDTATETAAATNKTEELEYEQEQQEEEEMEVDLNATESALTLMTDAVDAMEKDIEAALDEQQPNETPAVVGDLEEQADTTEASLLDSMAAGIEQGLTAAMDNLMPEELAEAEEEKEELMQIQQDEVPALEPEIELTQAEDQNVEQSALVESEPAAPVEEEEAAAVEPEKLDNLEPAVPVEPLNSEVAAPVESETPVKAEHVELADPVEIENVEPVAPVESESVEPVAAIESEQQEVATPVESENPEPAASVESENPEPAMAVESENLEPLPSMESENLEALPSVETENLESLPSMDSENLEPLPSVESQNVQQPAQVEMEPQILEPASVETTKVEQAETQPSPHETEETQPINDEVETQPEQEETSSQSSLLTTIIPMIMSPIPSSPAPVQVADSVLNYVNASFLPLAEPELQKTELEPTEPNAHLRRYDGAQVWRIVVQTDKDKKLADELQSKYDGQLWKEVKQEVDYLLKPQVLAAAERHIRAANLSRIVLIDNLQHVIEVENPPAEKIAELQNRKGHRLTWQAYHRLEDIHGFIDYMAKTYPDICSTEIIGYSVEKRPLKILKISNGNARNPGIWIDGGMHAREWISPATVTFMANQLVEGWEDLPEHMRNINWYIHPVANPDGYEYSHTTDRLWRKNMRSHGRQCPGVDLNRNFGYKWGGKGTSASPCSQTYRGSKAFSEPETFYISKFISGFPRETFQAYLSFHSYGQYILYPWGYDYHLTQDRADLDRVARQAGTSITKSTGVKYTVGSSATTLYPAAGGSDDWAKGIAGIKYAYTIEMGDTGRYGFVLPARFIQYNGKDGYTFADTVAQAIAQGRGSQARRRRQ